MVQKNFLIILLLTFFIFHFDLYSQTKHHQTLYSFTKNGKIGFINRFGKIIVKPKFLMTALNFSEGFIAVTKDGTNWGFIDSQGKLVINYQFDYDTSTFQGNSIIPNFSEGLAAVKKNNKFGYINYFGKFVIPLKFDIAYKFSNGLAMVKTLGENGKYYTSFINHNGEIVLKISNNINKTEDFYEEHLMFWTVDQNQKQVCGFLNKKGETVINANFTKCSNFKDGLAIVTTKDTNKEGVIDVSGNFVIQPIFADIPYAFYENLAVAALPCNNFESKNECFDNRTNYGFINKDGNFFIKPQFTNVKPFVENRAIFYTKAEYMKTLPKCGYIDKNGKIVIEAKYLTCNAFQDGLAKVLEDSTVKYIDKNGKSVFSYKSK